jgi:N-acetylglucosaminyl-diphospho-decaprenol L-rhamnosyltransferase
MHPSTYSLTFACYNAVDYTKMCIESMVKHGTPLERLVAVDNGSTDETLAYLRTQPLGALIENKKNLGCGVAWNQGALVQQAEWTIIMNNDVLVSEGWVEGLIETAKARGLKIISPAMIEGACDYDFDAFAKEHAHKMAQALRPGHAHAVCLAVHESVWMEIGYFYSMPFLWGYEDTLFFHAAKKAGIPMAITGASWLHHFGSITQSVMKRERGLKDKQGLSGRYNYRLLHQSWLLRKLKKIQHKRNLKAWREEELSQYGATLHGIRSEERMQWA